MTYELDPLLRGAVALTLLGLLSRGVELAAPAPSSRNEGRLTPTVSAGERSAQIESRATPCPRGTLPDGDVCVPVPATPDAAEREEGVEPRERARQRDAHIPRQPERPENFRKYRLPVATLGDPTLTANGDDDGSRPDGSGEKLGLDLVSARGAPVHLVRLEDQLGDATLFASGVLLGNTVVTLHARREAGLVRQYLLLHGHLERVAAHLARGAALKPDAVLGYVGDSGRPGVVALHLEVRRVREGVDGASLELERIRDNATSVDCDPRNVLELAR